MGFMVNEVSLSVKKYDKLK